MKFYAKNFHFVCLYVTYFLFAQNRFSLAANHNHQRGEQNKESSAEKFAVVKVASLNAPVIDTYEYKNSLSKTVANFSLEFTKQIASPTSNVFFSPISIISLLGMLWSGSSTNTFSQIKKAVFKELKTEDLENDMKNFTTTLKEYNSKSNKNGQSLTLANRIYGSINEYNKFDVSKDFQNTLYNFYGANFEQLEFVDEPENSRKKINQWVSNVTQSRINELFKEGTISSDVSMVLVNAIFFKGIWTYKFDGKNTTKGKFYSGSKDHRGADVNMMVQKGTNFWYFREDRAKVLGMPYDQDQRLAAYVILPVKKFDLADLEKNLTDNILVQLLMRASDRGYETTFTLPKFKIEKDYEMNELLKKLGMTDMFDASLADFTNINNNVQQYVSKAVHKSAVEVTEEGTTTPARSGASIEWRHAPEIVNFIVDEPFLFVIFDTWTENILFYGRVASLGSGSGSGVEITPL